MAAFWRTGRWALLLYLLFLLVNVPASIVLSWLPPSDLLREARVQGTLWRGELHGLKTPLPLPPVRWHLRFHGLLPALALEMAEPQGLSGQILLSWRGYWRWQEGQLTLPADRLASLLPLPVPLQPQGQLQLHLQQFQLDRQRCIMLDAHIIWQDADIDSPLGSLALGEPQLSLSCQPDHIQWQLVQQSPALQATGSGRLTWRGYQFSARLQAGERLPAAWRSLLQRTAAQESSASSLSPEYHFEGTGEWTKHLP